MTLRLRFLFSLIAVIAIMAVPAIYGVTRVGEVRDIALDLREQAAGSALAVGDLRTAIAEFDRYQRYYLVAPEEDRPEALQLMWGNLNAAASELDSLRAFGYADAVESAAIPVESLRDVTGVLETFVEGGNFEQATDYREYAAAPLIDAATDSVPQLAYAIDRYTAARFDAAERSADAATTAALTAMLIAIALAGALAVAAAGVFSAPIERLASAMARVADGDFEAPRALPYERHDEIGNLSR